MNKPLLGLVIALLAWPVSAMLTLSSGLKVDATGHATIAADHPATVDGGTRRFGEECEFTTTRIAGDDFALFGTGGRCKSNVALEPCDEADCDDGDKAYATIGPPTHVPEPAGSPHRLTDTTLLALPRHRAAT